MPGPPTNLCGREEDGVLVGEWVTRIRRRHVDVDVWAGRREVPDRERAMSMEQARCRTCR